MQRIKKDNTYTYLASLFKSLSHPHRLKILCCLYKDKLSVKQLETICGAPQPVVSQHLKKMYLQGIITPEREGNYIYYRITNREVLHILEELKIFFNTKEAVS